VATSSGTTTTTSYVGSLEEVATTGGMTTTTAYYGGLAESVNGTLSYLLSDGLGSVSESVTTSGAASATQLYGPYGGVRYASGTLPTSKGFTGQRADSATSGLDYYGARYYDPVAGQLTSADTTLAGGLNRYAYVAGNPETATDPTGHCPWCIAGAIIGAVVGAGIVYGVQVYNNYQNGASNPWGDNIDWGAVAMGALAGAFIGATMGAGATAAAGVFAAGGSAGAAASAGAGAAAVYAGYGIAPTVAGAEASDVELDAELGLAGNRAARTDPASSAPPVSDGEPQDATPSGAVWYNRHGQLTNGAYTVDESGMQPHLPFTEAARQVDPENGLLKSVFLSDIDAHKAVLDAAMYADNQALWNAETGRADVPVTNGPTGVDGASGQLVSGITVSRSHTNFVRGWPNEVP
jgi:RHS repeat-associated protein